MFAWVYCCHNNTNVKGHMGYILILAGRFLVTNRHCLHRTCSYVFSHCIASCYMVKFVKSCFWMQDCILCKRALTNYTFGLSFAHNNEHFYAIICWCFSQLFTWFQKSTVFASCVSFVTCLMLLFCSKVTAMQQGTERS